MAESETEKAFSSNPFKGKQTVKRLKNVARNVPVLGTAFDVADIASSVATGNLGQAAVDTGLALAGTTPVGRVLSKGAKFVTKAFRKKDIEEAEKLIDDPEKLKKWQEKEGGKGQRQENPEDSKAAAEALFQGEITSKETRKRIGDAIPAPKEYTADQVKKMMPTVTDVTGAMGKKAKDYGIIGVKGFDLIKGQLLGARLDIPAYNRYDKWVVSIHDGTKEKGSVLGYGQAIRLKNVRFGSSPKEALDIARRKLIKKADPIKGTSEKRMGKTTIARAFGEYVPEDPYELQKIAADIIESGSKKWTQVGMNPYRGSHFYDKKTGKIIFDAEEMIQVGPLVLAKNAKTATISDLKELAVRTKDNKIRLFNEGGTTVQNQMEMTFMQEGGLQDEGGTVDPVSGNDVPSGSTKKEVRDDIPAMLSEGEFVFPADVVRYIGLNKLMQMRQEAKMGLQMMEKMGQMGNSDEAEIPDDLPFGVTDIVVVETDDKKEDDKKDMAQGGVIYAQEGTDIPSNKRSPNKLYPVEYTDKDGNIKIINEDYLGAPQGSASDIFAVTMGALKRKTPYDPPTSTDSLEDSSIPKSSLESTESTGKTGFYYKGFTGERELTPEQIEFLKKTKPKVFSDERIKAQGLQKILNSQNRLGFIFEPEEAERRKKEKRKKTREKNRRDLLDARVQQDIEKLGITKEQYYNSDKDGNPVEGGLTFKDRLDLAKKDIQERVEKLPIELSQKKQLVKQSLDNFKKNKSFSPAVVTDPTPPIPRPNLLPEVPPIGVAKPTYTSPEVRVDPTIENYMKPVDAPSSTPLPSVSVLPPPIAQDAQPLKVDPTIEVSPTPYIPQTSSDKAQTTPKPVDAATFVTETVLNYLKTLFPNDKKSQNEVLKEAFNMGTGVAKPSPRGNLRYKKGGLMKKDYP